LFIDTTQEMRVLWFNWRDVKHPDAGGAEILTHEVMLRLARIGYDMTLFCPSIPGGLNKEEIDGVELIRSGGTTLKFGKVRHLISFNRIINSSLL
jgi:hypothetical protein